MKHSCTALMISMSLIGGTATTAAALNPFEATVRDTDAGGRILIELSYPTPAGDPKPEIEVTSNGRSVDVDPAGEGFGGGRSTRSVLVNSAGFGAQSITIEMRVGGETLHAATRADFAPRPVILPGWVDDALAFEPPGLRLEYRFLSIDTVLINGAPADFGIEKMMPRDGVTYSGVIIPDTAQPGTNIIEIAGTGWRGDTYRFTSRFVYAPAAVLHVGQVFSIQYGDVGSKSGPFYQAVASSDILEQQADVMRPDGRIVKTWRAARPGTVAIVVSRKSHFLQGYEVLRSIELTVAP